MFKCPYVPSYFRSRVITIFVVLLLQLVTLFFLTFSYILCYCKTSVVIKTKCKKEVDNFTVLVTDITVSMTENYSWSNCIYFNSTTTVAIAVLDFSQCSCDNMDYIFPMCDVGMQPTFQKQLEFMNVISNPSPSKYYIHTYYGYNMFIVHRVVNNHNNNDLSADTRNTSSRHILQKNSYTLRSSAIVRLDLCIQASAPSNTICYLMNKKELTAPKIDSAAYRL